tara:strand:- start:3627 stop:4067 length:441 start_codon:yes stop_codon:yes gene_type:complete
MTAITEEQTLMGFAYDHRQKFKDSEYKELCELIMEKEEKKKKYVKVTYKKVKVDFDEHDERNGEINLDCNHHPTIKIFEIMPVKRASLKGWDHSKITQEEFDEWKRTSFRHPIFRVMHKHGGGGEEWVALTNNTVLWVMEAYNEEL